MRGTGMRQRHVIAAALAAALLTTPLSGVASLAASAEPAAPGTGGYGTSPQTLHGSADDLALRGVRVVERRGGDRIVIRFRGNGRPGAVVHYVRRAVADGSGEVLDVAGGAILQVDVAGTPLTRHQRPVHVRTGGDLVDVEAAGPFEGYTQVFLGLEERTAFRAKARSGPSRIVIDLKD